MRADRGDRFARLRDDAGTTLLELVVAMTILTIFMGVFTVSTLMMTRNTNKVQAIAQSVEQGNTAFRALDRTVRYATGVSTPDQLNGVWNVEYSSTRQNDGSKSELCTQLRIKDGQLQQRSWIASGAGYATGTLTDWRVLASGVTNGSAASGADVPFVASVASGAYRRLTITLVTSSGATGSETRNRTTASFVAENSTVAATNVCTQLTVEQS